jgi:ferredoxin
MRVHADAATCIGSGNCADVAPRFFGQDPETALVIVRRSDVDETSAAAVEQAAELCPVRAIQVDRGGQPATGTSAG